MGYRYAILGAGRQGCAVAYDLLVHGKAESISLVDREATVAEAATRRIQKLTHKECIETHVCPIHRAEDLRPFLAGRDAVISALPYFLNPVAAEAALAERAHFTDLGGNTEIVKKELRLDAAATGFRK